MGVSQSTADYSFVYKNFASLKTWIHLVIESEGAITGELSIVFSSDNYLLSMNRDYLHHDYYTDVITFDYSENKIISGDIFISVERVIENACLFEVSVSEELDRVILHGVLHLLGYNDSNDLDVSIMRSKEAHYLPKR